MNPKLSRRNFLETALKSGTATYLATTLFPNFAYSEESNIFVPTSSIPSNTIYTGTQQDSYQDVNFVLREEVFKTTPTYQKYKEINPQQEQAKSKILLADASTQSIKWIKKFAEENRLELLLEKEYYEKHGSPFKQVPEQYKNMDFQDLMDELDVTYQIIQEYSK
jgi:hypothetical protein